MSVTKSQVWQQFEAVQALRRALTAMEKSIADYKQVTHQNETPEQMVNAYHQLDLVHQRETSKLIRMRVQMQRSYYKPSDS